MSQRTPRESCQPLSHDPERLPAAGGASFRPEPPGAARPAPPLRCFGDFELDEEYKELRRSGERVDLQRRPLELLLQLVRHRQRVVSKEELFETVWSGLAVSDAALASAIRDLRRVLGDDGREQRLIRTYHGFGYRFAAAVRERRRTPAVRSEPAAAPAGGDASWMAGFSRRLVAFLAAELAEAPADVDLSALLGGGRTETVGAWPAYPRVRPPAGRGARLHREDARA